MIIENIDGKVKITADEGMFLSVDGNKETIMKDGLILEVLLDETGTIPEYVEIPLRDKPVIE